MYLFELADMYNKLKDDSKPGSAAESAKLLFDRGYDAGVQASAAGLVYVLTENDHTYGIFGTLDAARWFVRDNELGPAKITEYEVDNGCEGDVVWHLPWGYHDFKTRDEHESFFPN